MSEKYYKCTRCSTFFTGRARKFCTVQCRWRDEYARKLAATHRGKPYPNMHPTCMEHATESDAQDFANRFHVDTGGCWLWHGSINKYGHGQWHPHTGHLMCHAHRAAYELFTGPIPEGMVIDHLCRNRACVNPSHLEAVMQSTNLRRGKNGNRGIAQLRSIAYEA